MAATSMDGAVDLSLRLISMWRWLRQKVLAPQWQEMKDAIG